MSAQWIAVIISAVVMVGGTAINLFVIGKFVGTWSEAMKNIASVLKKVEERVEEVEDRADVNEKRTLVLQGEVNVINNAMDKFWELRDAFMRLSGVLELTAKQHHDQLEALARGQAVIERQLGNIAKEGLQFRPGERP